MSHNRTMITAIAAVSVVFGLTRSARLAADDRAATIAVPETAIFETAVVAADHPLASRAGAEILRQGGNVVDAAVATSFALAVVRPEGCGLGGGGFMVIWNARTGEGVALDYRERAPLKAARDMFAAQTEAEDDGDEPSRNGHQAIAVPGHVAGLCFALKQYGTLDLKTVLRPAMELAQQGFPIDEYQRKVQADLLARFRERARDRERFRTLIDVYLNGGKPWAAGDRFQSPLRNVLEQIAAHGPDGFYRGAVAKALIEEIERGGGLITADDLQAVEPVVRKPLRGRFDELEVLTMPPPSSGGVALVEALCVLAEYEASHPGSRLGSDLEHNSAQSVHLVVETLKHVFADRAAYLGDPDFVSVPVGQLIGRDYARRLAGRIDPKSTQPTKTYGRTLPVEDAGTSHISVIDRFGNAVACTETINTWFGSLVVEPQYGIVLNNQMDDFSAVAGRPNAFGLIQSEANAVGPGKKPVSSMTPTILVRDGRAMHVLGASGGPRIISATLQVLLNRLRYRMPAAEAVSRPRVHHQWLPDVLYLEPELIPRLKPDLERLGHSVEPLETTAVVQLVTTDEKGLCGASDPRKQGKPAGF